MNETSFFNYEQYMPHGMCYLWKPEVLWVSVISDVLTALAYFSITIAVIVFVKKRQDLPYPAFFILVGSIIFLACGTSHLISAIVVWKPIYGISAISKAITAVTSVLSGILIWKVLPFFLGYPSPAMLKRKNAELKASLDKLQAAQSHIIETEKMAAMGSLVAGIAHELNTPIGVCITANSSTEEVIDQAKEKRLTSKIVNETFTQLSAYIELISRNLTRSADLIDIFKEVAVEFPLQHHEPFNLKEFLTDIVATLKNKYVSSPFTVNLVCNENIWINSHSSFFIHIFSNLTTNTINHGFNQKRNDEINITVSEPNDGGFIITYSDNGIGMTDSQVEQIFEPFFTSNRGQGGPGLGMTIVYNTVSKLNGHIQCISQKNEGTTFIIKLPSELQAPKRE